ncbi:hypothetical protein HT576_11705 [Haloterrigena sp. SYSU A121-1]|uniref:Uncharacterized protein n=1 Tax=Haloterrigena gelatinilytica TaxID=2741724 RepID=A0A8J8KHY4_9EURY|nr:hypothetical protein [Haloterrigena gelatinilytica]NUB91679.1 hypothetical protein [Haloterrigena gelatinilytica]
MFEYDTSDSVSKRSVLKAVGTLLSGTTLLTVRTSARTGERFDFEITETTAETVTARVRVSAALATHLREVPSQIVLGHRDQFGLSETDSAAIDDAAVERTSEDGVATPDVMASFERADVNANANRHVVTMQFRTREIDFSEAEIEDGMLTMGLFVPRLGSETESVVVTDEIESSPIDLE